MRYIQYGRDDGLRSVGSSLVIKEHSPSDCIRDEEEKREDVEVRYRTDSAVRYVYDIHTPYSTYIRIQLAVRPDVLYCTHTYEPTDCIMLGISVQLYTLVGQHEWRST
jgi:hypothetical protein